MMRIKKPYVVIVDRGVTLELEFAELEDAMRRARAEHAFASASHVSVWHFQIGDAEPVQLASFGA